MDIGKPIREVEVIPEPIPAAKPGESVPERVPVAPVETPELVPA